jgi:formate-dependent nitrite reductase membrane component NrfD
MSPAVDRGGPTDQVPGRDAVVGSKGGRRGKRRRGGGGGGEQSMVPEAAFTSYYGRPVVKASPWKADIPAYMFFGGVAAGSSLLAAGGDVTGRPALRRAGRLTALVGLSASMVTLVHDLGRPGRFLNMLRTAKPTSPMSVGTWILSTYGPIAGVAAVAEVVDMLPARRVPALFRLVSAMGRPAGLAAALTAPPVAAYTAVLLADTATPSWHEAYRELPFVFVGSAAAAAGGVGMLAAPPDQAGPARRMAVGGALLELVSEQRMESSMGITAEPLHDGKAGRLMTASKVLTAAGALGSLLGGRSRAAAAVSGAALVAGSVCTRFGIFEAGQQSARDPKYTVVPQRERLERGEPIRYGG